MEASEWRVWVFGLSMGKPIRDYGKAVAEARNKVLIHGAELVTLQARSITPWRDVEIPFVTETAT